MTTLLAQEVGERCRKFMEDPVFEKLLCDYVKHTGRKVTEMRLQDLAILLNDLVIPWEKHISLSIPLHYSLNGESIPFARCTLKDGKPDLSTVVFLE